MEAERDHWQARLAKAQHDALERKETRLRHDLERLAETKGFGIKRKIERLQTALDEIEVQKRRLLENSP